MAANIRLMVCHRNRLFRECLILALSVDHHIEVLAVDDPKTDSLGPLREDGQDLLLIDASLPDTMAFRLVQRFRTTDRGPRTILLVSSSTPDLIELCLQAGADGCVLDDDTLDDLRQAIDNVVSGRSYCSPQVAHRLCTNISALGQANRWTALAGNCELTRRELEILRMIAHRNLSNKQIARELRLSIYTVKNHVRNIIEKLSVDDRQTAARRAVHNGLLSEPVV
jgi:DNA-binding NarL/FixJ family response regulator